jgi:hypothetical protein
MTERASTPSSICVSDPQERDEAVAQEGVLNLVIDSWSLNMGRFFLSLTVFKAHIKEYVLEQGLEVDTTRLRHLALYLVCPEWTSYKSLFQAYISQACILQARISSSLTDMHLRSHPYSDCVPQCIPK